MKEGWTYKKLGEVCEIFNGNSINADFKKKYFFGATGGLPFIATKDVSTNGSIDYDNGVRIPNYDEYKVAPANSVFVCAEGGSAGKKFAFVEQDVCFGNKLFCLNPKQNSLVGKYIYYFVQSDVFKDQFYALLSGLIGGVSAKKFQQIEIPVSSIDEQLSIVSRLDAAFAHIDALKANAEKQLAEARQLFQAELAECMRPKEGWEEKTLPDISENLDSIRIPVTKKNRTEGKYPYYGASGIVDYVDDYLFDDDLLCISEDGANLLMRTYPIAFPISGKVWVNNHAHVLRFKSLITQKYVEYYFSGLKLDEYITGAAQPKLTQKALNSIIINIPKTIDIQRSIVSHLDALSANIKKLEDVQRKTLAECDALKQAMLREVFE
jgi:type I restriction enzyme S subunit